MVEEERGERKRETVKESRYLDFQGTKTRKASLLIVLSLLVQLRAAYYYTWKFGIPVNTDND